MPINYKELRDAETTRQISSSTCRQGRSAGRCTSKKQKDADHRHCCIADNHRWRSWLVLQ
jgi:hypothetical protein